MFKCVLIVTAMAAASMAFAVERATIPTADRKGTHDSPLLKRYEGSFMDLSQRRAAAVVTALVTRYGISKDRLTPVGVSFASPVASNTIENGRAKNRRVELVEN